VVSARSGRDDRNKEQERYAWRHDPEREANDPGYSYPRCEQPELKLILHGALPSILPPTHLLTNVYSSARAAVGTL
jgi:hypothetical protein